MKQILLILSLLSVFACQRKAKEIDTEIIKNTYLAEFPNSSDFQDSLCNKAIELAKSQAEKDNYMLYFMDFDMDSSDTPTHILMYDLNFKILGEYEKDYSYRYCYNQATYFYFELLNKFDAREYMTNKYDSLFQLGLTQEPPKFNGGNPLETVDKYFYCNMNFEGVEYGRVTVYFKLDSIGKAHVKLEDPTGHELDSVTLELFKNMPLWTPGRSENKKKYRPYDYTFTFVYDEERKRKYCI